MSNIPDNYVLGNTHTQGGYKINSPQSSNWKCHMFGKSTSGTGLYYTPPVDGVPNWFHRKMQRLILGHVWERVE